VSQQRITEALSSLFASNPIVFWHDADGEFASSVESLKPSEIDLLDLDATPWLQVKIELERAGRGRKFLLYSAKQEPDPASDWLLDVRLRSKPFRADNASILLEDLGLTSQQLRSHLKARAKFLRAKDRVDRLKKWVAPNDDADDLDRKMIGVLVKADQPELPAILLRLFPALLQDGEANLDAVSKLWADVVANDLEEAFWSLVVRETGYRDATPTLRDLLFRILVSDLSRTVSGSCPAQLSHFVLSDKALAANASVFASGWRSHMQHFGSYDALSGQVGRELGLDNLISGLSAEALSETMTFETEDGSTVPMNVLHLESGVITQNAMEFAAREGLVFATDPTSSWACTIGGNVAEASGGVEFLKVPSTYYEGLLDRVGPIEEDLAPLAELGILVDRDDEGYLLQLFTKPVLDRLSAEATKIIQSPDFKKRMDDIGAQPVGNSPAEMAAQIRSETDKFSLLVKAGNVTVE